ncbi:hypothetical protein STEG23_036044, partial [Scotinomys teguina]
SDVGTDKLPDVLPGPMIFHSQCLYKEAADSSYDMFVWEMDVDIVAFYANSLSVFQIPTAASSFDN